MVVGCWCSYRKLANVSQSVNKKCGRRWELLFPAVEINLGEHPALAAFTPTVKSSRSGADSWTVS